jgi:hypothetical protein
MPWRAMSLDPKAVSMIAKEVPLRLAVEEARVVHISVALVDVEIIQLTVAFQISSL